MASNRWKYAASSLAVLVLMATLDGRPVGAAKKKGVGKTVESNEITDHTITCDDISEDVFPNGCPDKHEVNVGAQSAFIDGTVTVDQDLPSTPSANDAAATIATLDLLDGSYVILASLVWSGSPVNFSGIVTCLLKPPGGPIAKAEFIQVGTATMTTGTLFATTTSTGAGTVKFNCTDGSEASDVKYRFLQLTAIQVPTLTSTKIIN